MKKRILINLSLFLLLLLSVFALPARLQAYTHINSVWIPAINQWRHGSTYKHDSLNSKIYSGGGTTYSLQVHGRVWGKCSGDMIAECTPNWWKVKHHNSHVPSLYSSTTNHILLSEHMGVGVARHLFQGASGTSTYARYTTEYGIATSNGASWNCYSNGPSANASHGTGLPCP